MGVIFRGTYYSMHHAGLFSILSTMISDITNSKEPVRHISLKFGALLYKNFPFSNSWQNFFQNKDIRIKLKEIQERENTVDFVDLWWHVYSNIDSEIINLAKDLFPPSNRVKSLIDFLSAKYKIDVSQTIAAHYRGTDKINEINQIPVSYYEKVIDHILDRNPQYRILLQVDDELVLEQLRRKYYGKAFYFTELPTSNGTVGAHSIYKQDRLLDGMTYLASINIISQCRHIVTHTGNGALWEYIYKGDDTEFIQLGSPMGKS